MSIATAPPKVETEPVPYLLTVADLAALPSELPSGTVSYELDNGRLVVMAPPGYFHSRSGNRFGAAFLNQGEARGFGKACSEVGIVLRRDPDRVVGADAAFIANSSLPICLTPEGYLETIPDLAVEVRSKNDTLAACLRKIEEYLAAGVKVVWLADPVSRTVTAHRRDAEPKVFGENDILTLEDIIPGFQMAVQDLFQE